MRIIFLFIFISFFASLDAQRFRHDINNYATPTALRNDFVTPKGNDKVYVVSTKKLYAYDASDTTTADDGTDVLVQGIYRWKCLNCSSGVGVTDGNKGDLTVTGDSWQLNDNAVGPLDIAPNAVVTTKIASQNVTDDKLSITGIAAGQYNLVTYNTKGRATAGSLQPYATLSNVSDSLDIIRSNMGGSGVPYYSATADTIQRDNGFVLGDTLHTYMEIASNDFFNIKSGEFGYLLEYIADGGDLNLSNTNTGDITSIGNGRINIARDNQSGSDYSSVLVRGEIETLIDATNIPPGGSSGQVATKSSNSDYAVTWTDQTSGSIWYFVANQSDTSFIAAPTNQDKLFNTSTWNVYQRLFGYWVLANNLRGAPGTNGTNGATGATGAAGTIWRTDFGIPSNLLGINGDHYLDRTTGDIYVKGSGIYVSSGNIKGPTGATGATGAAGADGAGITDGDKGDITVSGTYTTFTIDASTVNSSKIVDGTIVTGDIATGGVETSDILDGTIVNADIANTTIAVGKINATGTPSSTTFLAGDGTWSTPAGGGGGVTITKNRLAADDNNSYTWTINATSGKKYKIELFGLYKVSNIAYRPLITIQNNTLGATPDFNGYYDVNTNLTVTYKGFLDSQNLANGTAATYVTSSIFPAVANTNYALRTEFYLEGQGTGNFDVILDEENQNTGVCTFLAGTTLIVYEY